MRIIELLLLSASLFAFSACTGETENNVGSNTDESIISPDIASDYSDGEVTEAEQEEAPVTVSTYATEEFLLPLDDHSWELTEKPEYVVLHFTSAVVLSKEDPYNIGTVRSIFEENSLSIHYIIDREGKIHCWLPETRAAWHAGKGTFANDEKLTNAMNKYSIGIEMLAMGSETDMAQYLTSEEYDALPKELIGYTDAQYESLEKLVRDICTRNDIPYDSSHVIGHDMYNPAKTDPGELFDWSRLFPQ